MTEQVTKAMGGIEKPVNQSRVFIITESHLEPYLNLETEKVATVTEVIKLNINARSEEHLKHIFDDSMFRGYTKPTFVLIDDRHLYAGKIAELVDKVNVYKNINVKIIDITSRTLIEILMEQADLELQSRFDELKASLTTSLEAQINKPGEFHIDLTDVPLPKSIEVIKTHLDGVGATQRQQVLGRLKRQPQEEHTDPYLSYGEAIEMCKKGIDVACVNWMADAFLTVNSGAYVHADNFWSPGNKRVAMSRPDHSMSVYAHFLRTDNYGTVPHMVDFNDQFSEWIVASDRVKVKNAKIDKTDGLDKLVLEFGLDTFSTPDFELAPFWLVYEVLAKLPQRVTVVSDNPKSLLPHIVGSMKEFHQQRHNIVEESFQIDEDGIEGTHYDFRGVDFLCSIGLNDLLKRIEAGEIKDVILDDDSFKTDLRLDEVKEALQKANANWVTVSVKEQLFGIIE